jgi:penicillin-binding protein 2
MFVLAGVFITLILILIIGLFKVQILQHDDMSDALQKQNYRRIVIPGPRGDMYDREGRLLVGNRPIFTAVVYLNELRIEFRKEYLSEVREYRARGIDKDREVVAADSRRVVVQRYLDKINAILGANDVIDSKTIEKHFNKQLLLPMVIKNDLAQEQYARLIEQLPVDSPVQILVESARYYPCGRLAAHTLGFVVSSEQAYDESEIIGSDELRTFTIKGKTGRTGLELSLDDRLQGTPGGEIWIVDPSGYQQRRIEFKAPVKGDDIVTSLDIDIQKAAENALGEKTGAIVAMDVKTGEVLAMASEPDYDLNDLSPFIPTSVYNDIRDRGAWINRAVQGLYPPGSTFKMVTAIAGFMTGKMTDAETINCPGYLEIGGRKFYCDEREGHGDIQFRRAISESCNVFFYTIGLRVGIDALSTTARMMGFDKPTGVELDNETHRTVVPDPAFKKRRFKESWFGGDTANVSIGQGYLLVTPLQMCAYTASLARGMTTTKPTLLKVDAQHPHDLGGTRLPIRADQYQAIMDGMRECCETGTGRLAQKKVNMNVSGKTGTAQIMINGTESTIAWFVCFAPSDDPQIAIAVMIEGTEPGDNLFGGSTSAPMARTVLQAWENKHPEAKNSIISKDNDCTR